MKAVEPIKPWDEVWHDMEGVDSDAGAGGYAEELMMYDHRNETKHWKTVAAAYRAEAASVRSEAEKKASALERDAERKEQLAHHICRLVTGDTANCCDEHDCSTRLSCRVTL